MKNLNCPKLCKQENVVYKSKLWYYDKRRINRYKEQKIDLKEMNKDNNQGKIVIYQTDDGDTKIDVRFVDETVWLTQVQLC